MISQLKPRRFYKTRSYRRHEDEFLAGRKSCCLFVYIGHKGSAASRVREVKLLRLDSKLDRDQVSVRAITSGTSPRELVAGADTSSIS